MNILEIKNERQKWMEWKNIAPIVELLKSLPVYKSKITFGDVISIMFDEEVDEELLNVVAKSMMPWRKGPFSIGDIYIDTEWQSYIKYNFLRPHFNLHNKKVADIGCNNGYYMFRFLEDNPQKIVGFDPSPLFKCQFDFINHFAKTSIIYEMLGVEHLPFYGEKFDTIFCLGVLYHRSDPILMLKQLLKGLSDDGEVILDTFIIEGSDPFVLSPDGSYAKMSNIYFIPTIKALENWCKKAGFFYFELLGTMKTTIDEQRKTSWIESQSLQDFLDPVDSSKTIEGYPAPIRGYVKIKRG